MGGPAGRGGREAAVAGGAMSETISGGKSEASASTVGDDDAVAEAEAETVLEMGAGLLILPASPGAVTFPVATEDGAAPAVGGGSSSPAEAIIFEWTESKPVAMF